MNSVQSDASTWVFKYCTMLPPVLILLLFLYDSMIRRGNPVGQPRPIFLGVPEGPSLAQPFQSTTPHYIFRNLYSFYLEEDSPKLDALLCGRKEG